MTKKNFKRLFLGFLALYFVMFAVRAIYDLVTFSEVDIINNQNIYFASERHQIRNYASLSSKGVNAAAIIDQKYERIANLVSATVSFSSDLGRVNRLLEEHGAIVQMENSQGLTGARRIDLVIGVRPESFDAMQAAISQIGRLISSTITKTDKTYEYRQMLAEKETLERRRVNYEELKKHGGNMSELLQLETVIIEVESQIQHLLIGLGEYSDENALCTINFTLYEGSEAGVLRKLWNSLIWSTTMYLIIIGLLMLTSFGAIVIAWCWSYLKKLLVEKTDVSDPGNGVQKE